MGLKTAKTWLSYVKFLSDIKFSLQIFFFHLNILGLMYVDLSWLNVFMPFLASVITDFIFQEHY